MTCGLGPLAPGFFMMGIGVAVFGLLAGLAVMMWVERK